MNFNLYVYLILIMLGKKLAYILGTFMWNKTTRHDHLDATV